MESITKTTIAIMEPNPTIVNESFTIVRKKHGRKYKDIVITDENFDEESEALYKLLMEDFSHPPTDGPFHLEIDGFVDKLDKDFYKLRKESVKHPIHGDVFDCDEWSKEVSAKTSPVNRDCRQLELVSKIAYEFANGFIVFTLYEAF